MHQAAQVAAPVDVGGKSDDLDRPAAFFESGRQGAEDIGAARGEAPEKIEIERGEGHQGDTAIRRRRENRVRSLIERIERAGDGRRARRDVAADENRGTAV